MPGHPPHCLDLAPHALRAVRHNRGDAAPGDGLDRGALPSGALFGEARDAERAAAEDAAESENVGDGRRWRGGAVHFDDEEVVEGRRRWRAGGGRGGDSLAAGGGLRFFFFFEGQRDERKRKVAGEAFFSRDVDVALADVALFPHGDSSCGLIPQRRRARTSAPEKQFPISRRRT